MTIAPRHGWDTTAWPHTLQTRNLCPTYGTALSTAANPHTRLASESLRVLCVDDDRDTADSLALVLRLLGFTARSTYDGERTLALSPEFAPHVCLIDVKMQGMDGCELACRLATLGPPPPALVAVSAYGSDHVRRLTARAGFRLHLAKPVDLEALPRILRRLARERGGQATF